MGRFFVMRTKPYLFVWYKRGSRFVRKIIEHKRFRSVFNSLLIFFLCFIAVFPTSRHVFGQTETAIENSSTASFFATEEIILTTKKTSRLPVIGPLSQGFSYYHPGIDIEAPFNEAVYPFLQGVIAEMGSQSGGYGNYVLIDHKNGYFSLYAHLNTILVKKDNEVTQDTAIGSIGLTGYTTGSHLHMEIYENGIAVNPLLILPQSPFANDSARAVHYGGPSSLAGRTLIRPISQLAPVHATASANPAIAESKEKPTKVLEKKVDIVLPTQLIQTAPVPSGAPKLPSLLPL